MSDTLMRAAASGEAAWRSSHWCRSPATAFRTLSAIHLLSQPACISRQMIIDFGSWPPMNRRSSWWPTSTQSPPINSGPFAVAWGVPALIDVQMHTPYGPSALFYS